MVLHTETSLMHPRFQHNQLSQIIFSLLFKMNITVLFCCVALTKINTLVPESFLWLPQQKYVFIYLHSKPSVWDSCCFPSACGLCMIHTGLGNTFTSVVTLAQGHSGDWWPCPHTHTNTCKGTQTHTQAGVFRQVSLTTTQGHAHRSRQTQQVISVGTRCDLKSFDWIRGKHRQMGNWSICVSRTRKMSQNKDITETLQDDTWLKGWGSLKVKQTRGSDCFLFNGVAYDKVMTLKCLLIESPSFFFSFTWVYIWDVHSRWLFGCRHSAELLCWLTYEKLFCCSDKSFPQ